MKSFVTLILLTLTVGLVTVTYSQQLQHPVGLSSNSNTMVSRAPDSRAWSDPALNHNKLLQQQTGEGTFKIIGHFKVKGTPFLYGERHRGNVFSEKEKAWNIYISFNTYNQELEFYSTSNPNQALVKEPGTLDSFIIQEDPEMGITKDLKFIFGPLLGTKDKSYYLEVCGEGNFVFYKQYKSGIGIVPDNIAQPDLRQFELDYDYYYYDKRNSKLKRLKRNPVSIADEFKDVADLNKILTSDAYYQDQEGTICTAFSLLNESRKGF